ncbi:MAG: catechol 2,3-dioxygenase-like lactoylglutathione lyase family enzyme [bacterium]
MKPTLTHIALHVASLEVSIHFYQYFCAMKESRMALESFG